MGIDAHHRTAVRAGGDVGAAGRRHGRPGTPRRRPPPRCYAVCDVLARVCSCVSALMLPLCVAQLWCALHHVAPMQTPEPGTAAVVAGLQAKAARVIGCDCRSCGPCCLHPAAMADVARCQRGRAADSSWAPRQADGAGQPAGRTDPQVSNLPRIDRAHTREGGWLTVALLCQAAERSRHLFCTGAQPACAWAVRRCELAPTSAS